MQQDKLYAGDSLNFATETPGYSAADGWVLYYRLVPVSGAASAITLSSTAEGSSHRIQATAVTTAAWSAGDYAWSSWVQLAGETYTVQQGRLTVVDNPRTVAAGTDLRSHAERVLESIEAVIENRATQAQSEYQVAGRQLKYTPLSDLLALRDKYRWEVKRDRAAARGGLSNRVQVRL